MKLTQPSDPYIEKAKHLSKEEAEHLFSRMRRKLSRRLDDKKLIPLEAIALQLELEDQQLQEWRDRLTELREAHPE